MPRLSFAMLLSDEISSRIVFGHRFIPNATYGRSIQHLAVIATVDIIPIAFLDEFYSTGGLPSVNLANIRSASSNPVYPGTQLPTCSFLASGIQTCQKAGKIVTISLGGATGSASFANDAEGQAFAQIIWGLFLGGTSATRPFGPAVLDRIDMDIEGGSQRGFTAFLTTLRQLMDGGSKRPTVSYIGNTINAVPFDAVFVQSYDYSGLNNYGNPNDWNFATWDNWAKSVSPNRNVKVFISAPASSTAAGSGYVGASTISTIIDQMRSAYSSFGGVMLWDISQARANNRYDVSVKNLLKAGLNGAEVSPWSPNVAYVGGDQVMYNGHLWTAGWWTCDDVPGGPAAVWVDDGACMASFAIPAAMGGQGRTTQATFGVF